MFCPNCGADLGDSAVCPNCASEPYEQDEFSCVTEAADARPGILKAAFSDPLFLVMCILLSVSGVFSVFSVFSGGTFSLPIINILFVIALWLVFASTKTDGAPLSPGGLKLADGTTTAVFVIYWVIVGLCAVGTIAGFALAASSTTSAYIGNIISQYVFENVYIDFPFAISMAVSAVFIALAVVCVIAAVVMVLINLFLIRNLKKFIHSVRVSSDTGVEDIQKARTVSTWLIVLAVFNGISTLSELSGLSSGTAMSCISSLSYTALIIIACIWVKRHFVNPFKPISF